MLLCDLQEIMMRVGVEILHVLWWAVSKQKEEKEKKEKEKDGYFW